MNTIVTIESHLPAASFELEGKCWLACGANWIEVDHVYTQEELKTAWKYKPQVYAQPVKKQKTEEEKIHKVLGSTGKVYTVKLKEGKWSCNCPASEFHRHSECKHIKQVKSI
jgi:hypothetical protein